MGLNLLSEKPYSVRIIHSIVQWLRWCVVAQIHSQKRRTGVIAPKRFVQRLKKDNELFRSYMHQVELSLACRVPDVPSLITIVPVW